MMSPQTAANVRAFLATASGTEWIEHIREAYPKLKLGAVSDKAYEVSLYEASGWNRCVRYLADCVIESRTSDFGQPPIDTVRD
jgi:hypothetical protein